MASPDVPGTATSSGTAFAVGTGIKSAAGAATGSGAAAAVGNVGVRARAGVATAAGEALGIGAGLDNLEAHIIGSAMIEAIIGNQITDILAQPRVRLVLAVELTVASTGFA